MTQEKPFDPVKGPNFAHSAAEQRRRLKQILDGPWEKKAAGILSLIRPPAAVRGAALKPGPLVLSALERQFGRRSEPLRQKMASTLAAHWNRGEFTLRESLQRDAFDEALTLLQLFDLGLATGYLGLDACRQLVRVRLAERLWLEPARKFVRDYEYRSVQALAERVEVDLGLGRVKLRPPARGAGTDIHFTAFVGRFVGWYDHQDLDSFLGLLDGYQMYYAEVDDVHEFLVGQGPADDLGFGDLQRHVAFVRGYIAFVFAMRDILGSIPAKLRAPYEDFFAYWVARFFGFTHEADGYEYDDVNLWNWSRNYDVECLIWCQRGLRPASPRLVQEFKREFDRAIGFLHKTWDSLRRRDRLASKS